VTLYRPTYTATLITASGQPALRVVQGSVTLNEAASPYAYASLTIARPAISVLAALDPTQTTTPRVRLTVNYGGGNTRTFDLLVSARQLDTASALVGINLVGDEQLVQDFSLTSDTPDRTYWSYQSSVRGIVYNVLNRVLGPGFLLTYGTLDRSVLTFSTVKNLIPTGSFEAPSATWAPVNNTLTQSTAWSKYGLYSLQYASNSNTDNFAALDKTGLQPGSTYTMSAWYRQAANQTGTVHARARSIVATAIVNGVERAIAWSAPAPNAVVAAGSRLSMTFTVPSNAEESRVRLYDGAANHTSHWDGILLTEGDGMETNAITPLVYFDGDTTDTTSYNYDWDDVAGSSSSTRTPVVARDPETLTWTPGQSAWDFLTPILQAVGMRLFCDETRTWRLVDNDYALPRVVHIDQGMNLYGHSDLMSRTAAQNDGLPLFADAVVIQYTWLDQFNREQIRYDKAGPAKPQKAYRIERPDTAYPGPGAAAYVLSRLIARRRQLAVTGAPDLLATPGQEVSVSAPMAETQTGYVDGVSWNLASSVMTLMTKGLISVPVNSIGRAPSTQTIGSVLTDLAGYTN
jgi:hypothetical protein